jgi:membrane protein
MASYEAGGHGEYARSPGEIPRRGWMDVAKRVFGETSRDNLSIVAAGVAFYGFLAAFPAIAALVLVYGLIFDPQTVTQHLAMVKDVMPQDAFSILEGQVQKVAGQADGRLSVGLALTLALSLWSSTKGIKALMTAMNIAYEEEDERGFFMTNLWALGFTLGAIIVVIVAIVVIAAIPAIVAALSLPPAVNSAMLWLRWLVLALFAIAALAILYRYGPDRSRARLSWVTPGAIVAMVLWVVGSILFSLYVQNFGSYNKTFGSLGAVVVLLMWFYISAYVICLGAELNSELEHQTRHDSTTGAPKPMGERGAYHADNRAG